MPPKHYSLFALWIKNYGISRLANDLGVSNAIVCSWARMASTPNINNVAKIFRLKGAEELTLNNVYGHLIIKR